MGFNVFLILSNVLQKVLCEIDVILCHSITVRS